MLRPNKEQEKAIKYTKGPLLIVAGPGTGKTFVITEKIKYLIQIKNVDPDSILALTFTEKAASEMQERVETDLPYGYFDLNISTFHSFADSILREDIYHIGLPLDYQLLTEPEAILLFRENLFKFNLNYFRPLGNPNKFVSALLRYFSRLKDENISPKDYLVWVDKKESWESREEYDKHLELAQTYRDYQMLKIDLGYLDFGDLLFYLIELLEKRGNIRKKYQKKFSYLLIDEFQDTNIAQYEIIKLLAPPEKKPALTVVGDDSQAIYKFRGASVSNILNFKKDYADAQLITLLKNYRSGQEILDSAYRLIKNNDPDTLEYKMKINKQLVAVGDSPKGAEIDLIIAADETQEADVVSDIILNLVKDKKIKYADIAVLARANNHLEPFMNAFLRKGIPYQLSGAGKLFRRPEVRDLVAYLNFIYNPADTISLYRVLRMDFLNIDPVDIKLLLDFSKKLNLTLYQAIVCYLSFFYKDFSASFDQKEKYKEYLPFLRRDTARKLKDLFLIIKRHLKASVDANAGSILYEFIEKSGYLKYLNSPKNEWDEQKAVNISRFFDYLKQYETKARDLSVKEAVDFINLSIEFGDAASAAFMFQDPDLDAVRLLTVHSAKGLEFDTVFVVNMVKQRFPTRKQAERIEIPLELVKEILPEGDFHLQEERRLFYVALTRAKNRVFITAAKYYAEAKRMKILSPFVYEIFDEQFIEGAFAKEKEKSWQLSLFNFKQVPEKSPPLLYKSQKYSFSQLDTFITCPLQYKYQYILRLPVPPTAALSFGNTIHRALYRFYQLFLKRERVDKDILINLFKQEWIPVGYSSLKHQRRAKREGEDILINFYEQHHREDLKILALEKNFNLKLEGKIIAGKIDRVDLREDGKIEIIDYKTGKKPKEAEIKKSLQLSIYALSATQPYTFGKNISDIRLSFYYLSEGEKFMFEKSESEIKKASDKIVQVIEELEKSNFPPKVGRHCDFCPFRMICPAWK